MSSSRRTRSLRAALWPALACLALAGCATPQPEPEYGAAIRQNVAAQLANPMPPPTSGAVSDGARVAGAQERYRAGRVIAPSDAGASKVGAAGTPQ
ncbi:MAG: hypothetical protein EPO51_10380 [Phenylobacterium sp.]|uniref:hypothetical protein n=1 Tax=Phenylobacterium sp. TaxID=1871053 RepID=UPI001222FDE6|nr:hypothetical protein [Phenylobacterium sp.]TAJ72494.1 MAG: hypothetical protein EPO51_10380 [Phenylobacterium sp.]